LPKRAVTDLIRKLKRHSVISGDDERLLEKTLRPRVVAVPRSTDIVCQGDHPIQAVFVLSGMLARYHMLDDGRRQYLSVHIAGDWPDLQSLFLKSMDHSLMSVDKAEIAAFLHDDVRAVLKASPAVTFAMWRQTLMDAAILRQAIANNGLRSSIERVAHVFCEQCVRARDAELTDDHSCSFPLTQDQIAGLLGLSLVSINRAVQKVRRAGAAELRSGRLVVHDWEALRTLARFDDRYLHLGLVGRR